MEERFTGEICSRAMQQRYAGERDSEMREM
jgi:hypothetical protein